LRGVVLTRVLHAVWPLVAATAFALPIIAIPAAYAQLRVPCRALCTSSRATPQIADAIVAQGYSMDIYAAYIIALCLLVLATSLIVGGLLYRVRAQSPLSLTGAYGLALFPYASTPLAGFLLDGGPLGQLVRTLEVVGVTAAMWFFVTFPDGRFVPVWTRWVLAVYLAVTIPRRIGLFPGLFTGIEGAAFIVMFLVLLASWAYRYRSSVNPEHRRQMRWAIFGFIASFAGFLLALGFTGLSVSGVLTIEVTPLVLLASFGIVYLSLASVPVWLAIAILRHRLYDIDLLIKRTIVYGATTAAIAATFCIGILALQRLVSPLTSGSEVSIAASTLLSLALFQPIRRRIQVAVDRRFDRSRYDAARTLEGFADQLRDEVDLDALRADLIGSVQETMAPAHTSLWLREVAR
jgi:hypothetical protein